ncbi:mucosa-associated lymphoid tissue lymphoma translocation protein 1-like isoform X3 [Dermochelys coriacea]|uniref:mucosa-associated lymphoid tissue lymphoma translocation protein 1-like isoform X3 n=1 Tax=Dermochelys coriacea TaxID=27794 RepID=UPI0018E753FE|nr:mucosa-associated lymphoid tissue lymphoma translocation protein 1-like isoform X3 [Dermochelys coriacea]
MPKAIVITEQPASTSVPVGYSLTLRCRVTACTSPKYQWFYQCQSACCQIVGATEPDLLITARETRLYICRINDLHKNVTFSNWVRVEVHQHIPKGLLPELWQGEPIIVLNPTAPEVQVGKPLQLQCAALGVPAPHYQWYHNGTPMKHQKKKKLLINSAKLSDSGTYLCCAANGQGEHWTDAVEIHIGTCLADPFFATDKVALLVGNNHYWNHPHLMAPITDVFELGLLLKRLGFRVVSLLDLNKTEMLIAVNQFLQLLGKGVYAIFYYAGHGYEHSGRNYMVPIDAPQPYAPENCISVQRILQKMQQRQTALNLILLDTCRKWYNPQCALSQVQPLEPWGNTVYGYATSEDAEAYEVQDGEFSSGIFMKYLKKHILQEKKVTHVLEDVLEELLKETLTFPCGIQVELRFQVVFSNVMHVSAKLQAPPPHVTDIRLLLCRPAEVQELAMQSDCQSDRMVSLLVSLYEQEELDCVLRLCGLQKIQTDVLLQLDLHYTQLGTKQRACESLQKILQKSLLAKLFSLKSSANPSCMAGQEAAATMCPKDAPAVTVAHEGPSSLTAEPRHGWQCSSQSNISSEPEENDESDLSSLCSALQRADPGQDCP